MQISFSFLFSPLFENTINRIRRKHGLLLESLLSGSSLAETFGTDVFLLGLFLLPDVEVFVNIKAAGLTNIAALVSVRI